MVPLEDVVERACDSFEARFGRAPEVAAVAPGRVNLIGEHTDYNGGYALPIAIDRWTVALAAAAPEGDGRPSRLWAIDLGEYEELSLRVPDESLPTPPGRFAHSLVLAYRAVRQKCWGAGLPNVDLAVTSTIPIGAGLSSSAALLISVMRVFETLGGAPDDRFRWATRCRMIEEDCGTPCGTMDPIIIQFGLANCALKFDCLEPSSIFENIIPLPRDLSILVADTGVRRELASSAYAERRATCRRARVKLNLAFLRDATLEMVQSASALTEVEHKRATHVVEENDRVHRAADALLARDHETLGDLLFAGHDSLRDLYEVSCPELDRIVDAARLLREEGEGVYGARMTGGGFGGCAVVLCKREREDAVIERLRHVAANVWPARAVDGARCLPLP